ncbi:Lytic transglycosylase catalytic [Leptothrix cholodnii SP-6]|uniref:Lytic transglycosylase catalytic n=2 Tax=Leptothrix cholodnii TaxID=34029 RepID=B1Y7C1_LEPCP|nr:Lytic transglycosylase catalytic [Leptothrix cholodnii SP-6]
MFAGLLMATVSPVCAQVYVSEPTGDVDAPLVLSNFSSSETPHLIVAPAAAVAPPSRAEAASRPSIPATGPTAQAAVGRIHAAPAVPANLMAVFASAAREHGVPASLLMAVAAAESGFNARAVSPKGALGLMQLMPQTARQHGVREVWSVLDNVRGGAAHLRQLLTRFPGRPALALAAYNAGEQAVLKAGSQIPPFDETQRYVPKVLAWQTHYQKFVEQPITRSYPQRKAMPPVAERRLASTQGTPRTIRQP